MKWIRFSEEKPKNRQRVLFYTRRLGADYLPIIITARNLYQEKKKYHPDYWCFYVEGSQEFEIEDSDFWCRIELPK